MRSDYERTQVATCESQGFIYLPLHNRRKNTA